MHGIQLLNSTLFVSAVRQLRTSYHKHLYAGFCTDINYVCVFETRSHFITPAGLDLAYVDQSGLQLVTILLALCLPSSRITSMCHYVWLDTYVVNSHSTLGHMAKQGLAHQRLPAYPSRSQFKIAPRKAVHLHPCCHLWWSLFVF